MYESGCHVICRSLFLFAWLIMHSHKTDDKYLILFTAGGDNRGHLHENIAPGAGTFTYFLQPISPSPRLCPGWGDRGFTLTGA